MYVEYKRVLFAWLTFSIKFGGKQRWIVSSHQYSSSFFPVSWEMAPIASVAFFSFALFRKKRTESENTLKTSHDIFLNARPKQKLKIDDVFKQSWKLVVSSQFCWWEKYVAMYFGKGLVLVIRVSHLKWASFLVGSGQLKNYFMIFLAPQVCVIIMNWK